MTRSKILEVFNDVLCEHGHIQPGLDPASLEPHTPAFLNLDSLDILDLELSIETRLGITFEEPIPKDASFANIVDECVKMLDDAA